jgi:hypothetical protein
LYIVFPYSYDGSFLGKVVRVDLVIFGSPSALLSKNLALTNPLAKGYRSLLLDSHYLYLLPYYDLNGSYGAAGNNGLVARIDTLTFGTPTFLDLKAINSNMDAFQGGCIDGYYMYLAPYKDTNVPLPTAPVYAYVPRIRLSDFSYVDAIDLNLLGENFSPMNSMSFDGRYLYGAPAFWYTGTPPDYTDFAAHSPGILPRIDTQNFSLSGVSFIDLTTMDSDWDSAAYIQVFKNWLFMEPWSFMQHNNRHLVAVDIDKFADGKGTFVNMQWSAFEQMSGFEVYGDCFYMLSLLAAKISRMKGVPYK